MTTTHKLTSGRTTAEIEARDTREDPLPFAIDHIACDERYRVGDNVILTSKDGDIFIGELSAVEEDRLRIYVELS